jgi:hypothetical protein
MYIVSMVATGIKEQYPPIQQWTYPQVVDLTEVLKKLDKIDKQLGAKECHEPEKEKLLEQLAARVAELERQLGKAQDPNRLQPTYFVKHPDESFSVADPQPISLT